MQNSGYELEYGGGKHVQADVGYQGRIPFKSRTLCQIALSKKERFSSVRCRRYWRKSPKASAFEKQLFSWL